jgi:hypothetical protein
MNTEDPQLACASPAPAEYCALRCAAGLSAMDETAAATGLAASWCAVSLRLGRELVAMGRIVGDGALFLQVVAWPCGPTGSGAAWVAASWPP